MKIRTIMTAAATGILLTAAGSSLAWGAGRTCPRGYAGCIGIFSLYYMAKGFVQKISDFCQRVAFYRFTPFCSISPLFRVPTIPLLIGKTSVYFASPVSISLIHLGTVGTFFPERSIFTISSVSSFLQNLSRI